MPITIDSGLQEAPISLLIAVHNRVELTRACLDSVLAHADTDPFAEIVVIDDCSTDGTGCYLGSLGDGFRVLTNETRGHFGQNMNRAAALAGSDYLLLLNNDTVVTAHWSRRMLDAARRDPAIAIVGNRQLHPETGLIVHAGIAFDHRFLPAHLHAGRAETFPPALIGREFQAVTGACWLIRRALFLKLGGFDVEYRNGWEDIDFCLRARAHGFRIWYAAESVIYHHTSASEGRFDHEDRNQARFGGIWRGKITPDLDLLLRGDGVTPPRRPLDEMEGEPSRLFLALRAMRRHRWLDGVFSACLRVPGVLLLVDLCARGLRGISFFRR